MATTHIVWGCGRFDIARKTLGRAAIVGLTAIAAVHVTPTASGQEWGCHESELSHDALTLGQFGSFIAADTERVVVCASTLANSDEITGAIYIYRGTTGGYELESKLTVSDSPANRFRLTMVSIDGDIATVARQNYGQQPQRWLHVFERNSDEAGDSQWTESTWFSSVEGETLGPTHIVHDGSILIRVVNSAGSLVRVYEDGTGEWAPSATLSSSDFGDPIPTFGVELSASGDWLAVAAPSSTQNPATVCMYRRSEAEWQPFENITLTPAPPFTSGHTVRIAVSGDLLVVGCPHQSFVFNGAIWIYRFSDASQRWEREGYFESPREFAGPGVPHSFGASVATNGKEVMAGAPYIACCANPKPDFCARYEYTSGQWRFRSAIYPHDILPMSSGLAPAFGSGVAMFGAHALCTAPAAATIGPGGSLLQHSGGVWVFDLEVDPIAITRQPEPLVSVHVGGSTQLSIEAEGAGQLRYQWRRWGTALTEGSPYHGVASSTLIIEPVTTAIFGSDGYRCMVTSDCGVVISDPGIVMESPPPPCLGDGNDDDQINAADITATLAHWGATYGTPHGLGDSDHNGFVNFDDLTVTIAGWGSSCP